MIKDRDILENYKKFYIENSPWLSEYRNRFASPEELIAMLLVDHRWGCNNDVEKLDHEVTSIIVYQDYEDHAEIWLQEARKHHTKEFLKCYERVITIISEYNDEKHINTYPFDFS